MTRMRMLLTCVSALCGASIGAQSFPDSGSRVRLSIRVPSSPPLGSTNRSFQSSTIIGSLRASDSSTVAVFADEGVLLRLRLADLDRIDASRGHATRWLDGAVAGSAIGAFGGFVYAAKNTKPAHVERDLICWQVCGEHVVPGRSKSRSRSAAFGAAYGALIGVAMGASVQGAERWRTWWRRQ